MTSKVDERKWTEGQRMQEFFRVKAAEGDSGFAIAYALMQVAHSHRKRSHARSRSNDRPHGNIVDLSEAASDEELSRAFDLEASTPGDD
jgi:hypothetical protein